MNQTKNKQYTKTHKQLQQLLSEWLQTKELSQLSVRELCQQAQINRSTFYYHYLDVYDLADQTFQEANRELMAKFKQNGPTIPLSKHSFASFFQYIKENQKIFRLSNNSRFHFPIDEGLTEIQQVFRSAMDETVSQQQLINHIVFFQAGFTFLLRNWLDDGCSTPINELVTIVQAHLPHDLTRKDEKKASSQTNA